MRIEVLKYLFDIEHAAAKLQSFIAQTRLPDLRRVVQGLLSAPRSP